MLGYAIMLSMKREYGFSSYLDSRILENLQKYFRGINEIPKLEELCVDGYLWRAVQNMSPQQLADNSELSKGHAISYVPDVCLHANCRFIIT